MTAGKKVKGRKRHIVTDMMGNLLAVVVHAANIHDTKVGIHPSRKALQRYPTIQKFCVDAVYRKTFELQVAEEYGLGVDFSVRIKPKWDVLPKRWVVERTLSWLNGFRRLSKDYKISTSSEEANVMISHLAVLLRRL